MTVALIDGDVLCYLSCESRYITQDGMKIITLDPLEFTQEQNDRYLERCWMNLQSKVRECCELAYTDEYKMAIKGIGNYRQDIYPEYKMHRHVQPEKRNPFVPMLRQRCVEYKMATEAHGMEADDQLRMWATECQASGEDYVIFSVDKDLKMIPGRHHLLHKHEFVTMSEWDSLKFYYEQLLQGDMTDNIKGAPGVGPIKAQKYLADCTTEKEMQEIVMQVYYTCFGRELWSDALFLTGQLIYLKKNADDWFTMDGWPRIEFEDIEDKPKKAKKGKKVEPWTLETALAAIDPLCIVTKQRWESALMFLAEQDDTPPSIIEAIEVLSGRDDVPAAELEAYNVMIKHFKKVPTSFEKVVVPMPVIKSCEEPDACESQTLPAKASDSVKKIFEEIRNPLAFKIPEIIAPPAFSSNWGKK